MERRGDSRVWREEEIHVAGYGKKRRQQGVERRGDSRVWREES